MLNSYLYVSVSESLLRLGLADPLGVMALHVNPVDELGCQVGDEDVETLAGVVEVGRVEVGLQGDQQTAAKVHV